MAVGKKKHWVVPELGQLRSHLVLTFSPKGKFAEGV